MKKLVAILFVVTLIAMLPLNAFAATGINANEQAVLDLLENSHVIGENCWDFSLPQEYVNTAKNYFAGDCDMTAAEKDAIIAYIEQGKAIVKKEADSQKFDGTQYNLAKMSEKAREEVLALGQKACAEVDLKLTYIPKDNDVVITPVGSNTPVFESAPVVKTTGEIFTVNAGVVAAVIAVALVMGTAVMFGISKKNGLFAK